MIASLRIKKKDVMKLEEKQFLVALNEQLEVFKSDILREIKRKKWKFR